MISGLDFVKKYAVWWSAASIAYNDYETRKEIDKLVEGLNTDQLHEIFERVAAKELKSNPKLNHFFVEKRKIENEVKEREREKIQKKKLDEQKARQAEHNRKRQKAMVNYPGDCEEHNRELYWDESRGFYCPLCDWEKMKQ